MSVGGRGAGRRWVAGSPSLSAFGTRGGDAPTTRRPRLWSWTVGSEPIHVMITSLIMTWIGRNTERVVACRDGGILKFHSNDTETPIRRARRTDATR